MGGIWLYIYIITSLKMIMSIMLWDSPLLALKKQASMLCATVERATQQGSEGSLGPTASKEMNAANATKSDGSEHWEWVRPSAREQQQWHQKASLKRSVKEQPHGASHSICLPSSSHGDQVTTSNKHVISVKKRQPNSDPEWSQRNWVCITIGTDLRIWLPRNKDWMSNVNVSPATLLCFVGKWAIPSDRCILFWIFLPSKFAREGLYG